MSWRKLKSFMSYPFAETGLPPKVETVSEGPPDRSLADILRQPPTFKAEPEPDPDSMEYKEWFAQRPWMQTASGKRLFLDYPEVETVLVKDVAAALARICRFGGHLRDDVEHYSVAQHSVLVSLHCKPEHALLGLFHDAHEAYWGDIISPESIYKGNRWRFQENLTQLAIGRAIGVGSQLVQCSPLGIRMPPDIKQSDNEALATERRDLRGPSDHPWTHVADVKPWPEKIVPLGSRAARELFLERCWGLGLLP